MEGIKMNEKSKILIIEDDTDLVAALKILLETKDYQVETAFDPEEGNSKMHQEKPDLIILDVMFGNAGESKGFDFAQKIRYDKQYADIPILILSAINTEKPFFKFSPDTDGEFLPVDSFIDKPVKTEELYKKVEELLSQKTSKWRNWPDKS
jgi:DNA-binding response OmpR family regulator